MIKKGKKVSVIIPVYNTEKYLSKCLDSVINQTYKNIEIIIVDDCSSDNSLDIINSYNDSRIKVIHFDKNKGVSIARNKGIKEASGKYICFLDSDDFWDLEKIEKQVKFIENNNYTFIYSDYSYYDNGKLKDVRVPRRITYREALGNTTIFTSTVMFNMNNLEKEDIYMPIIKRGQDTATWWKVLKKGIDAFSINEVLAYYRVDNKSLSSNKIVALIRTWRLYKVENINIFMRLYYFTCYIVNAVKRRV